MQVVFTSMHTNAVKNTGLTATKGYLNGLPSVLQKRIETLKQRRLSATVPRYIERLDRELAIAQRMLASCSASAQNGSVSILANKISQNLIN